METVCHALCDHVVHLLAVLGQVVVVGLMSAGCGLLFLFGFGTVDAIVGVWYASFCVGTLATLWFTSCGAVFLVCTARNSLRRQMRLLREDSNTVEAGVSSSATLGNFGLGGC